MSSWVGRLIGDIIPHVIGAYVIILGSVVVALVLVLGFVWLKFVADISRWPNIRVHDPHRRNLIVALSAGGLAIAGLIVSRILDKPPPPPDQPIVPRAPRTANTPIAAGTGCSDRGPDSPSPVAPQCPVLPSNEVIPAAQELGRDGKRLRILGGPDGGFFLQFAKELQADAAAMEVSIEVIPTGGSKDNLIGLSRDADPGTLIALTQEDIFEDYEQKKSLQVLNPEIFQEKMYLAVPKESKITSFSDLKTKNSDEKRKKIGVLGSGSKFTLGGLLAYADINAEAIAMEVKSDEVLRKFRERQIDAFVFVSRDAAPIFSQLQHAVRFVPVTEDLLAWNPFRKMYHNTILAISSQDVRHANIHTLMVWTKLVAHNDLDCRFKAFVSMLSGGTKTSAAAHPSTP